MAEREERSDVVCIVPAVPHFEFLCIIRFIVDSWISTQLKKNDRNMKYEKRHAEKKRGDRRDDKKE